MLSREVIYIIMENFKSYILLKFQVIKDEIDIVFLKIEILGKMSKIEKKKQKIFIKKI